MTESILGTCSRGARVVEFIRGRALAENETDLITRVLRKTEKAVPFPTLR